ncbi:MAG: hypothetical protein ACRCUA_00950, partial [Fusobacteriaceae bacterium]
YFSGKKMVIESQLVVKSNEPQTMSQPEKIQIEPIVEAGEKRRDMGSLLGGLMVDLTVKGTKDNLALNRDLVKTENLVVEKVEPVKKDLRVKVIIGKEIEASNSDFKVTMEKNNDEVIKKDESSSIISDRKEMAELVQSFAKNFAFMYFLDEDTELNLKVEVVEIILNSENVTKDFIRDTFKKLIKRYI